MSTTITLEETVEIAVLCSFELQTQSGSSASTIGIAVNINGTDYDSYSRYLSGSNDTGIGAITHRSAELAPGTYTVKMRFQRISGASTPGVNHMDMLVMGLQGAQGADGVDGTVTAVTDATSDMLFGVTNVWTKKTLVEGKAILGITNAPNVTTTAASDTMMGDGAGAWVKKTKAETMAALEIRESLTANRAYYVRTDGDDANNGLTNTAGGAFLTIQAAVNAVSLLDIKGYTVTINVADGTYTTPVNLKNCIGFAADGNLVITGNSTTPANVIISTTSASCFTATGLSVGWRIINLKVQTTTFGNCLYAQSGSSLRFGNLVFGSCAGSHMRSESGAYIGSISSYAITGGAVNHMFATFGSGMVVNSITITSTGTFAFTQFANAAFAGWMQCNANTYTGGTITGKRYDATLNGVVNTSGGGANYFPGDAAGTTATGGQYA